MRESLPAMECEDAPTNRERTSSERPSITSAADLVHSERLVTLGWLAASVGHDLRTPLAAMRSNAGLVLGVLARLRAGDIAHPDEVRRALATVEDLERTNLLAVDRLAEIVAGLKALAPVTSQGPRSADLGLAIDQTLRLCNQELQHVVVRLSVDDGLCRVAVPDAELMQVLMNLVLNAAQAITGEGTIEIRAWNTDDSHVTFTVVDDGPGLAPGIISRLFEPGITTRAAHGGTGLGLSIVKRIVDTRGGRIDVANEPRGGVRFVVGLPVANDAAV